MALRTLWGNTIDWMFKKLRPDEFYAVEQPTVGYWKGLIKSYDDPAYALSADAYKTMLATDVIMQPVTKFAERMSGMQITVVGSGKRRDALQKIVDAAVGVPDALYWLAMAKLDGVRFLAHRAVYNEETKMYVPDFRGCGARKWKAGGTVYWEGWAADESDPTKSIGKLEEFTINVNNTLEAKSAVGKWYDRADWTVFRPGAGTNPDGEVELIGEYFLLAESARLLDKALRVYADRYSLPRELLKEMINKLRPDELVARMQSGADKIKTSNARTRMAMGAATVIELLEPKGTTFEFLLGYRAMLEKRVHKLVWGEDISSGSQESGDRGGRDLSSKEALSSLVSFGKKISDTLTEDWLPWIIKQNEDWLPRLRSGEPIPYLDLRPSAEKQRLTVAELVQVADRRIPIKAADVYATLGLDMPEGTDEVFKWEHIGGGNQPGGGQPSNTGNSTQRKDREQKDSGLPAEKPQDSNEDLRNADKEQE